MFVCYMIDKSKGQRIDLNYRQDFDDISLLLKTILNE